MVKTRMIYACQNCHYESPTQYGRCPNCGAWNQMEAKSITAAKATTRTVTGSHRPQALTEISLEQLPRLDVQSPELNRVFGGGLVPDSLTLIGGDPGIGKSTLLMQLSGVLADHYGRVLYVSGEENVAQIKRRAQRMEITAQELLLYSETDLTAIREAVAETNPDFIVIDSIQTMSHPDVTSQIGSVTQIREITAELMRWAKGDHKTIFVVGHVTKDGSLAGPKVLEHMVDTVLYFEGDHHHSYRILRSVKNRFGPTNELGIFEMKGSGLQEVANPSALFLEERLAGTTGSAVVASMEGTRPILVEIQALITPTMYGNPKRTAAGIDHNKLSLLMAVLEKRANLMLQNQDAYVKATGGVRLDEPAIDLAVAVAIASSYRDWELPAQDCFIGELGLTGEIRRVDRINERIKEAQKLGFQRIYLPQGNRHEVEPDGKVELQFVRTIQAAIQSVFKSQVKKGGQS